MTRKERKLKTHGRSATSWENPSEGRNTLTELQERRPIPRTGTPVQGQYRNAEEGTVSLGDRDSGGAGGTSGPLTDALQHLWRNLGELNSSKPLTGKCGVLFESDTLSE